MYSKEKDDILGDGINGRTYKRTAQEKYAAYKRKEYIYRSKALQSIMAERLPLQEEL